MNSAPSGSENAYIPDPAEGDAICHEVPEEAPSSSSGSQRATNPRRRKNSSTSRLRDPNNALSNVGKLVKAPGAPRRFKSAFIFFSAWKHKLIKDQLARDGIKKEKV